MANPNTIVLKGEIGEHYDEGIVTVSAIKPGMLIKRTSGAGVGTVGNVAVHSTAGGAGEVCIAIENAIYGKIINDSYAVGERCRFVMPETGDWCYLAVAAGAAAIAYNDPLSSAGDGTFRKEVSTGKVFFLAEEAKDNSAGGSIVWVKARRVAATTA